MLRTATFRLTLGAALFMAAALLLLSALIFWQATEYRTGRTDRLLAREAGVLAAQPKPALDRQLRMRASDDLHLLINAAGLFDASRRRLSGNLPDWPRGLVVDGHARRVWIAPAGQAPRLARAQARRLPDGDILVLARDTREVEELARIVWHALAVCAIPALLIAVAGGAWLSHRAMLRVGTMHRTIERIMQGDLHERLPVGRGPAGRGDDIDRLAGSVNRMLGRLEHLLDEIKGVGDDIAHDLRTPLTRVRTRLERVLREPGHGAALDRSIERAIADLDQCFAIITALLRITEIENGRRRAAFTRVPLKDIVTEIVDLYEPIAETRAIALVAATRAPAWAHGDRDLLIELAANLVDNAIKFTAEGGRVEIGVRAEGTRAVLSVGDTGIGIPEAEREAVLVRFHRSDKSRHVSGSGLGLSLVAAIARLHDATLLIRDAVPGGEPPGCLFEVSLPVPNVRQDQGSAPSPAKGPPLESSI